MLYTWTAAANIAYALHQHPDTMGTDLLNLNHDTLEHIIATQLPHLEPAGTGDMRENRLNAVLWNWIRLRDDVPQKDVG